MSWFRRSRPARTAGPAAALTDRKAREATVAYLREFVATRVGVEAYVEPATHVTPSTVMLVATDGEWTRRRVPDARAAGAIARELGIPVYDVQRTGYPQRMRDWTSRTRAAQRRGGAEPAERPGS
ncbi:oxidoreductase [Cellulomonas sp. SG140]|uniref:oxidoreductase n=1 Tax=Cellulomonas sp. SG140 TaxID=2976536 RepID=UPI0021E89C94|nr:oxidoreductase [Cellulomonas sp. SG140]